MINTPEKVERTLEQLQTKVALLDGEVVNLKKAKLAEQITIQRVIKEKGELQQEKEVLSIEVKELQTQKKTEEKHLTATINKFTTERNTIESEVETLQMTKNKVEKDVEEAQIKLDEITSDTTTLSKQYGIKKEKVEKLNTALDTAQKALDI